MATVISTVKQIEALRAGPKVKFYRIDSNLRLRVGTNGAKSFNVRFRVNGRNQEKTLGPYGHQPGQWTLHAALAEAAKVAAAARADINILEVQKQEQILREGATLSQVFEAWFAEVIAEKRGRKGRKDGGAVLRRQCDRHWKNRFGDRHIGDITKSEVIANFRAIARTGMNRTAVVTFNSMRQMMTWANRTRPYKRLLVDSDFFEVDVADVVLGDYDPVRSNERTRTLADDEIVSLARQMRASTLPVYVLYAVFIMLGTGCRVGELSMARWSNVDLDAGMWTLPAPDTKTQVAMRIALSPFALRQFEALRALNPGEYVFPLRPDMTADAEEPISNQQIGKLIAYRQRTRAENREKPLVMDYDSLVLSGGRWRCHDLRRTAATIMQRCGVDDTTAHRCLNHAREDALDRVYLQELLTPAMRQAWQALGTYLDRLLGEVGQAKQPASLRIV